jgi:hypothetical protein
MDGKVPLTITKSQLRQALRVTSRKTFRGKYCTDEVILQTLGMSLDDFNRTVLFDVPTTRRLVQYFDLGAEDFAVNPKR